MSEELPPFAFADPRDAELLRLRFPERERDYGALSFLGPFSDEELRWADLGYLAQELPIPESMAERWFISLGRGSLKEAKKAVRRFVEDLWEERGWPKEGKRDV